MEKVEQKIRNSNIGEINKKIIFDYEKQLFIKEFSIARIERSISVLRMISEKLDKHLALEKGDIETFLEWVQRKDIGIGQNTHISRFSGFFLKMQGK